MSTNERGTKAVVIANTSGHGFPLGTEVVLHHYDTDGDAVWAQTNSTLKQMWFLKDSEVSLDPGTPTVRTVVLTSEQETSLVAAAQAAEDATQGDSNDKEIEALREAYEYAFKVLGIKIPEGREPCSYCEKPAIGEDSEGDPVCDDHTDD